MNDIFISYARVDREKARVMAEALERQGYKVWWDPKIPPGKRYDEIIERALNEARCVVVLWSHESIGRDWVKEEASVGLDRGILLPVKIEPVNPPLGFRRIQAADLTDWTPGEPHQGFSLLLDAIAEVTGAPSKNKTGQVQRPNSGPDSRIAEGKPALNRFLRNSIGMEFALIPVGTFTMGSRLSPKELARRFGVDAKAFNREKPAHRVFMERSFYLQTTPVTQGQWLSVMGWNPSHFKECGEDCPVESVSWDGSQQFIRRLSEIENINDYRLPIEAEWKYACRAGNDAEFSFGDDVDSLGTFAWYSENSDGKTHPVGVKEPNGFGLCDMHGNVFEWVEDDWHDSYEGTPGDGAPWVDEPRGAARVMRGGSFLRDAVVCRSAYRSNDWSDGRSYVVGFRLSRSVALGP